MGLPLANTSWDDAEINAAKRVLDSGHVTMGKYVKEFELKFSEYVDSRYAVMCNSGSSANLLIIAALAYSKNNYINPGDEVIVPSVSWSTTYFPLAQYGLKIRFVDIDINTLNYNLSQLEECINENTRLVVAVNLLGNPNNFTALEKILKAYPKAIMIEDNCESLGATFNNQYTGTFGLAGSFSTYFSHHISTIEGGIVVTDDEELYELMLAIRAHGWTRDLPEQNSLIKKSTDDFHEMFNFIVPGYNLRPMEISGAIGIEQLRKLPKLIDQRKKNAQYFKQCMDTFSDHILIQDEIGESSWFGFSIIVKPEAGFDRKTLLRQFDRYGIEYRPIVTGNFTQMPVMKYLDYESNFHVSNAELLNSNGMYIGNHHFDISDNIDNLSESILHLLKKS